MTQHVTVGIDGSVQSAAAAEWAAREAHRRGLALRMIHVAGTEADALERELGGGAELPGRVAEICDGIAAAWPGLDVTCEVQPGHPAYTLAAASGRAELLVLGSRGLGGFTGLLVGSVGLRTAARSLAPVVLVRAESGRTDAPAAATSADATSADGAPADAAPGDVVVGVEGDRPCDAVLEFAFERAADLGARLRALESRPTSHDVYTTQAPVEQAEIRESLAAAEQVRLQDALARWQDKFPQVRVEVEVCPWSASRALVEASRGASLVVLGRRTARVPLTGPHLGPVVQSVLHHAHAPVAVVPHH
ncbi:universal stress protein [Kitasatospora sp. NPDC056184]|uniref:universal stress protein n=1 Tax=Kitasatospora sp. NPDC056184 TaxID=3345738 RepID=UPI0035E0FBDD